MSKYLEMKLKSSGQAKFVTHARSSMATFHDLVGVICSEMMAVGAAIDTAAQLPDDVADANDLEEIAKNEEVDF